MELYDEDDLKKEKKGKKIIVSLLVISIILLIILGIILVTLPRQTQQQRKSINLDGKEVIISEDLSIICSKLINPIKKCAYIPSAL